MVSVEEIESSTQVPRTCMLPLHHTEIKNGLGGQIRTDVIPAPKAGAIDQTRRHREKELNINLMVPDNDSLRIVGWIELVPRMASDLFDGVAGIGVGVQVGLDELPTFGADVGGDGVVSAHDLLVEQLGFRVVKRQVAADHRVQDDPC